ncbi:18280_t:CDS:2, partial [Acaulospora morrowiae]
MFFYGYKLEILVNGLPLPESNQFTTSLNVPTTTGPSYILDGPSNKWIISDSFVCAQVPSSGLYFSVRFSSEKVSPYSPLMAFVVVDGHLDYRY